MLRTLSYPLRALRIGSSPWSGLLLQSFHHSIFANSPFRYIVPCHGLQWKQCSGVMYRVSNNDTGGLLCQTRSPGDVICVNHLIESLGRQ